MVKQTCLWPVKEGPINQEFRVMDEPVTGSQIILLLPGLHAIVLVKLAQIDLHVTVGGSFQ